MKRGNTVYLVFHLLDRQLIDKEERRCGRVDDVQLEPQDDSWAVKSLIVGSAPWSSRLPGPIGAIFRPFARSRTEVPFELVDDITPDIRLTVEGSELGLGRGDDRLGRLMRRLPFG